MRITAEELLRYSNYLKLQIKTNKTFEENKRQGALAKEVICRAIFRFKFLDKPTLMTLLNYEKSNEGGFYRIMRTLIDEGVIKGVESKYTPSKTVYALKPKAFQTYLMNENINFYPKSKNKLGIGVRATHHLITASKVIGIIKSIHFKTGIAAKFLTEREIRARAADYFARIPDALINIGNEATYFVEFEFSNKNRYDRTWALINANKNAEALLYDEDSDYTVWTLWILSDNTMKRLYEREIFDLSRHGVGINNADGEFEERYFLNRNYHSCIVA